MLCELTDREVLGTEGRSSAEPRLTARAIVRDGAGLYAVMYAEKFNLYSLPGGGVEEGEDAVAALKREIWEETGCACAEIEELGCVLENRFCYDYTQANYYYVVTASSCPGSPHLTEKEAGAGTRVEWRTLEEVVRLISEAVHDTPQRKYMQARDLAALKEYLKLL